MSAPEIILDPLLPKDFTDRYDVIQFLGNGKMAPTYLCRRKVDNQEFVIKVIISYSYLYSVFI